MHAHAKQVKKQISRISSFLLHEFQRSNSGHWVWWQVPLPTEPCCHLPVFHPETVLLGKPRLASRVLCLSDPPASTSQGLQVCITVPHLLLLITLPTLIITLKVGKSSLLASPAGPKP